MLRALLAVALLLYAVAPLRAADVNFVLDGKPLALLSSPDIDGFYAERSSWLFYEREEIEGTGSYIPNIQAGVGFENRLLRADATIGAGYLTNDAFEAGFGIISLAPRFKLGPAITLGPRVAFLSFDNPEWSEEADISISAEDGINGMLFGFDFYAGGRKVGFHLNLDYAAIKPFEVRPRVGSGWTTSDDELDLSGVALQMGVLCHF